MPRPVRWLLGLDLLMGLLAIAGFAVSEAFGIGKLDLFRLGEESNVPTWYSVCQLALVGALFGALAARDGRRRPTLWLVPAFFVLLSLDEAAMLHERLGDLLATQGLDLGMRSGPWMLLALPVALGLALAAARQLAPYWQGRTDVLLLFGGGLAVLFGSAVGFELLSNLAADGSIAIRALGLFEEVGEMVGATGLVWAALRLLDHEGIGVRWHRGRDEPRGRARAQRWRGESGEADRPQRARARTS